MKYTIAGLAIISAALIARSKRSDAISRQHAIEAFQEYRLAHTLITQVHEELVGELHSGQDGKNFSAQQAARYLEARQHLKKSLSLNPFFPDAYMLLANSYWDMEDDLDTVIYFYTKSLEIDPEYEDIISARAQAYLQQEDITLAQQDLGRLTALGSPHAAPLKEQIDDALRLVE